ncbi:MAG: ribonuclease P protein subunit [Candidatus Bathyarchaeota archaeon]|nr:MAG: ribonuclease P protein subunit [Candidatus Bathyarchaeota archaeon]
MRITSTIPQHEFIGLNVEVAGSLHPSYVGLRGRVLNETRNTLMIRHKDKKKMIAKKVSVFHFTMLDGTVVEIDGKIIIGRSENRSKKRVRRHW